MLDPQLHKGLASVQARERRQLQLRWTARALLAATLGYTMFLFVAAHWSLQHLQIPVLALLGIAALLWVRRRTASTAPSLLQTAQRVDGKLQLADRLSAAVEFADTASGSRMVRLLLADAARYAGDILPARLAPYRIPREVPILALTVGLTILLSLQPAELLAPFAPAPADTRAERALIEEGRRLQDFGRQLEAQARRERDPYLQTLAASLQDLGERMEQQELPRTQALSQIAGLTANLRSMLRPPGATGTEEVDGADTRRLRETRDQLQRQMSPGSPSQDRDVLEQALRDLSDATGGAAGGELADIADAVREERDDEALQALDRLLQDLQDRQEQADQRQAADTLQDLERALEDTRSELSRYDDPDAAGDAPPGADGDMAREPGEADGQQTPNGDPSGIPGQAQAEGFGDDQASQQAGEGEGEGVSVRDQAAEPGPRQEPAGPEAPLRGTAGPGPLIVPGVYRTGVEAEDGASPLLPGEADFQRQAEQAAETEQIPTAYRTVVERYFRSLEGD